MKREKITYEIHSRIRDQTNVQTSQVIAPMVTQIQNQIRRQSDEVWIDLKEELLLRTWNQLNTQVSSELRISFMP
jgi:hypothetical protein